MLGWFRCYQQLRPPSRSQGRAVQEREEVASSAEGPVPEVFKATTVLLKEDPVTTLVRGVKLRSRSTE
jgi:hypothetical protein